MDAQAPNKSRVVRDIQFADCDPAQIMFYPRFFEQFVRCTEIMFRKAGIHWETMHGKDGYAGTPLVDASAKFHRPVRFGDTVEIDSWIEEIKGKVIVMRHEIYNRGELALEGREVRVYTILDPESDRGFKAVPVPDELRARLLGTIYQGA
jgi:4-hydroxybenzoyl-CoA thioesterase